MAFLKKVARAVASGPALSVGKSAGMFGGALKKAMPKIKEAIASGAAASPAAQGRGRSGLGGMLSGSFTATPKAGSANPRGAGSGLMGGAIRQAMTKRGMGLKNGGMAEDKAGRALGKKTADSMGRAMAKAPMKKNMGGMAKKSSKKC